MAFDTTNFLEVDATVEADFTFTDRAGVVDSLLQATNTAGQWCLGVTSTTSNGTGPTANPVGRSAFVYIETSTPVASTVWAMRRKVSFDSTTQDVFLDLIYNLNVLATLELYVEYATVASPNETTDWTILETIAGTATDAWISDTFDFSAIQTTTLWIRLRVNSDNNFTNDLAFSTWREYSVDTAILENGLFLTTADKSITLTGAEDPADTVLSLTNEWAAVSLVIPFSGAGGGGGSNLGLGTDITAIKTTGIVTVKNGATINGLTFEADVEITEQDDITGTTFLGNLNINIPLDAIIAFDDTSVAGVITNINSGNTLTINMINGSTGIASDPGTANGETNIQNSSNISFNVIPSIIGYEWRLYTVTAKGSLVGAVEVTGEESAIADNQSYNYNHLAGVFYAIQFIPHNKVYEEAVIYFDSSSTSQTRTFNLKVDINN